MKTGMRTTLISAVALLAVFAASWWFYSRVAKVIVALQPVPPAVRYKTAPPAYKVRKFTREQALQFLVAAQDAEDIKDPLQRCLKFPDPPDSHWNHAAVVAYCKYRNQPLITFAQAKQLIESGHAAKLDQMLAQALHEQLTDPDAVGRFDRIYLTDFANGSFDIRPTLDAWKRQSPNSAFAYAASGMAYEEAAFTARGGKWSTETPESNFESMGRLATLADADLQRAVQLNPRVLPAYAAMISLGGATFGSKYGLSAAKRGLAIAPGDLMLYDRLLWLEWPKWVGSIPRMEAVVDQLRTHVAKYPLLALDLEAVEVYRVENCDCTPAQEFAAYSGIVTHLTGYGTLGDAGDAAKDANDAAADAIYYSESLRFNPTVEPDRINRMYVLMYFHHLDWAVQEGNRLLARSPENEYALKARGFAYLQLGDAAHAQADLVAATRINPDDDWAQWQLGDAYMEGGKWDKAWALSEKLMAEHPKYAEGWLLRGQIQVNQPRPGLDKTLAYLDAHFASDSEAALRIAALRTAAQQRAKWQHATPALPPSSAKYVPRRHASPAAG